jgi:hypothetical protein
MPSCPCYKFLRPSRHRPPLPRHSGLHSLPALTSAPLPASLLTRWPRVPGATMTVPRQPRKSRRQRRPRRLPHWRPHLEFQIRPCTGYPTSVLFSTPRGGTVNSFSRRSSLHGHGWQWHCSPRTWAQGAGTVSGDTPTRRGFANKELSLPFFDLLLLLFVCLYSGLFGTPVFDSICWLVVVYSICGLMFVSF